MSTPARIALLAVSFIMTSCFSLFGAGISRGLEPTEDHALTLAFWFIVGSGFSLPLWLPAVIPSRHLKQRFLLRYLGALSIVLPMYIFGSLVIENLRILFGGRAPDLLALGLGGLLTTICLLSQAFLLKPEISSLAGRIKRPVSSQI